MRFPAILLATLCLSPAAWAAHPFTGNWKMNPERSDKGNDGQPRRVTTLTIKAFADGYEIQSSAFPTPFVLHLDGKLYKDDTKGVAAEVGADHSCAARLDARRIETTYHRNGKKAGTLRTELSADGRSLTNFYEGTSAQGAKVKHSVVFEKQ